MEQAGDRPITEVYPDWHRYTVLAGRDYDGIRSLADPCAGIRPPAEDEPNGVGCSAGSLEATGAEQLLDVQADIASHLQG